MEGAKCGKSVGGMVVRRLVIVPFTVEFIGGL